jgi:hypothetical protein
VYVASAPVFIVVVSVLPVVDRNPKRMWPASGPLSSSASSSAACIGAVRINAADIATSRYFIDFSGVAGGSKR